MNRQLTTRLQLMCALLWITSAVSAAPLPLWRAEVPETGGSRIYLLGSIHVLSEDEYPLDPAIEAAFADAELIFFETDVAALESPEAINSLMLKAAYPQGKSLKSELSSDLYTELNQIFGRYGLGIAPFNRFKPWFIQLFLTMSRITELGYEAELGLDSYLFRRTVEEGKSYAGLESVEEQLQLLESLEEADQEALLWSVIDDLYGGEDSFSLLVDAWRRGDLAGLQLEVDSLKEYPELYERLILTRNRRWAKSIPEALEPGRDLLVVVGAGHLGGEEGLIRLLEGRGFRFTQVEGD